jgi:hypothetical protein
VFGVLFVVAIVFIERKYQVFGVAKAYKRRYPNSAFAKKIFPDAPPKKAKEKRCPVCTLPHGACVHTREKPQEKPKKKRKESSSSDEDEPKEKAHRKKHRSKPADGMDGPKNIFAQSHEKTKKGRQTDNAKAKKPGKPGKPGKQTKQAKPAITVKPAKKPAKMPKGKKGRQ